MNDQVALHGRVVELTSQALYLKSSLEAAYGLHLIEFRIDDSSWFDLQKWIASASIDIKFPLDVPDSDGKLIMTHSVINELSQCSPSRLTPFGVPVKWDYDIPDGEVRAVIKLWSRGATS